MALLGRAGADRCEYRDAPVKSLLGSREEREFVIKGRSARRLTDITEALGLIGH